jgi:hypothetical protein
MTKKILLLLAFYFILFSSFSQERKIIIYGKLTDSLGIVKNANIINLKTNQGTFSSDNGAFRIFVSEGDSLRISSVQHITIKTIITKINIENKKIFIKLKLSTYVLDEFDLKKHNLSGRLGIDSKSVPVDKRDSLLTKLMDFSKVDMKIVEGDDYIDKHVRPPIVNTTPGCAGAGGSANMPFKNSERLWALRKKLAQKKAFPYTLLSELGANFFFEELKIPIENYFHFLEYCNPLDIESVHKEGKILEVIKILRTESESYLEIIKKE